MTAPAMGMADGELARAAQAGDVAALGLLLERHRAALHAHALGLVGHGPQAQDAVQDAFLVVLRKIGQLRDPATVEGWLHTVLRNVCLSQLRVRRHAEPIERFEAAAEAGASPEAALERLAHAGWAWTAIAQLSEPLRLVVMLRHFSACSSYGEIAAVCGVPIGTVRSRLSEGRRKLADALLATAEAAHADAAALTSAETRRIEGAVEHFERTGSHDRFLETMPSDVEVVIADAGARLHGRHRLAAALLEDAEAGVGFVPTSVICGPGITIVEARFVNPAGDPDHCPPGIAQVHLRRDDLTPRMIWHRAARCRAIPTASDQ